MADIICRYLLRENGADLYRVRVSKDLSVRPTDVSQVGISKDLLDVYWQS